MIFDLSSINSVIFSNFSAYSITAKTFYGKNSHFNVVDLGKDDSEDELLASDEEDFTVSHQSGTFDNINITFCFIHIHISRGIYII